MLEILGLALNNIAEIMLMTGIISILIFLYVSFGWQYSVLGFGIFSIIGSVITELNQMKTKQIKRR